MQVLWVWGALGVQRASCGGCAGAGRGAGGGWLPAPLPWSRRSRCPWPLCPADRAAACGGGDRQHWGSRPGRVLQMEPPPCLNALALPDTARGLRTPQCLAQGLPAQSPAPAGSAFWRGLQAGLRGVLVRRQLPLLGACPDLQRIPGIASGLAAGLGVQAPAHTRTHL